MNDGIQFRTLQITLTALEPMRIGGPADPLSERHNPVALVGGKVAVPGASLKGALRDAFERHLISKYWKNEWPNDAKSLQPCIPATSLSDDEGSLVKAGKYRDKSCHYPCDVRDDNKGRCKAKHSICPVCYLFGTQGLVGFVSVPFLFSDVSYGELYSARIDRVTSTVKEGTNRPYEIVPQDAVFTGDMRILIHDPVKSWTLGQPRPLGAKSDGDAWLRPPSRWDTTEDLVSLITTLLQGVDIIGGYKSKGCGRVKITVKEIK